ncbi:MAG: glycosyltransferase, partial [Steroidobacteraceae bacterium]
VIHPPVDTEFFRPGEGEREDYYLTASRLVPYKCTRLVIEAFAQLPQRRLVVIGDGPEFERLKAIAGPNVSMLGYQPDSMVRQYMQRARAFLFAAVEDFGIAPVEAQACGTPVIAFGAGGVTESVVEGKSGIFFQEQTVESMLGAIQQFERRPSRFSAQEIRTNALRFGAERFKQEFRACVEEQVEQPALLELAVG